jgi:hypothetical protein
MPETPQQPPADAPNVGMAGSVQMGPDGKQWGVLHISTPLSQFALLIPEIALPSLAEALPKLIGDLADEVRRGNAGLVLATELPNPKGKHAK